MPSWRRRALRAASVCRRRWPASGCCSQRRRPARATSAGARAGVRRHDRRGLGATAGYADGGGGHGGGRKRRGRRARRRGALALNSRRQGARRTAQLLAPVARSAAARGLSMERDGRPSPSPEPQATGAAAAGDGRGEVLERADELSQSAPVRSLRSPVLCRCGRAASRGTARLPPAAWADRGGLETVLEASQARQIRHAISALAPPPPPRKGARARAPPPLREFARARRRRMRGH